MGYGVLQCAAVCLDCTPKVATYNSVLHYCVVWCSVVQSGVVCCIELRCVALCCSVFGLHFRGGYITQCVAVCCSMVQCLAVCCSVL